MSHTPSPWVIDDERPTYPQSGPVGFYVAALSGGRIAQVFENCLVTSEAEARANAALLIAAPDLLRELKRMVALFSGYQGLELSDARTAIAKAEESSTGIET